ncbi:MAG: hypothetical protein RLZZ127_2156 [Planctomycetota bacterium]|jgi:hypothetical protein
MRATAVVQWFDRLCLAVLAAAVRAARYPSWWLIPAVASGWFLADLVSGLAHLRPDYHPCRPGVGLGELYRFPGNRTESEYDRLHQETMRRVSPLQRVLFLNKSHHPRPGKIARQDLGVLLRPGFLAGGLAFAVAYGVAAAAGWIPGGLATANAGAVLSQAIHAQAHRGMVAAPVRWAQAAGLLLSARRHALHHAAFDRRFCLVNGWADPVVDAVFRWSLNRGWVDPEGLEPR